MSGNSCGSKKSAGLKSEKPEGEEYKMKALMKKEAGRGMDGIVLCDIPKPEPESRELLIKVMAAGICGTDIHIMEDAYPHSVPVVLGHEFTGIVEKMGKDVKGFSIGDQVIVHNIIGCGHCHYCMKGDYVFCSEKQSIGVNLNGGMAEYVTAPYDHAMVVPESMKGKDIPALSEPLACCVRGVLEQTKIGPGDKVLVTGPGVIGLLCAQLAKLCGAYVIVSGTGLDKERLKLAKKQGADQTADQPDTLKEIVASCTEQGVDVVLECSGSAGAMAGALELIRKQGRYTQVGMFGKNISVDMDTICRKEIEFHGTFATAHSTWEKLLKLYQQDNLQLEELVSQRLPLSEWKKGFEMFQKKEGNKIFLIP
ncbi:L-threonine 3-dehydrogenase [uncultured Roseburia sp.]|nr:L-threonine 3-dehydrogenase [uncultured Roseburia sp.]